MEFVETFLNAEFGRRSHVNAIKSAVSNFFNENLQKWSLVCCYK